MAFDVFMRQVSAISTVSGQMSQHVASSRGRLSLGSASHGVFGASLLMGDALRLMALLKDIRSEAFEELHEIESHDLVNVKSMLYMLGGMEQGHADHEILKDMVGGLTQSLDVVKFEIGELTSLVSDVSRLASESESGVYDAAKNTLQQEILPEMYHIRDELEEILERCKRALDAKETEIWYMETIFKYVLPLNEKLKLRRKTERLVDDGTLAGELEELDIKRLRALIQRALRTRDAVIDDAIRERLEAFLERTAAQA